MTVPALALLFRRIPVRAGVIVLSALVAHQAWHWMTARGGELLQYRPGLPALDGLFLADTSHYYPEDRSISESMRIGSQLAELARTAAAPA